jgi:hypothetical protein
MIRLMTAVGLGGLLMATATAPSAFAQGQGSYEHHAWCLQAGAGKECAFDTLAQCRASKASGQGRCVRNTPASNH